MNRRELLDKHPDWYAVNRKGESCHDKPAYVDYYRFLCPNHQSWRTILRAMDGPGNTAAEIALWSAFTALVKESVETVNGRAKIYAGLMFGDIKDNFRSEEHTSELQSHTDIYTFGYTLSLHDALPIYSGPS